MQHLESWSTIATIEPELLDQELRSGRAVSVVDVRSREECLRTGSIPGARRMPAHQLHGRLAEIESMRMSQVVVVSTRGMRAHDAAAALLLAGFADVRVLAGGITRWCALGLPLTETRDRRSA